MTLRLEPAMNHQALHRFSSLPTLISDLLFCALLFVSGLAACVAHANDQTLTTLGALSPMALCARRSYLTAFRWDCTANL
jgi:hypothetical protein